MPPDRDQTYHRGVDCRTLVQQLADRDQRLDAMRALVGGVTATELRRAKVDNETLAALTAGVSDSSPQVRWWSIQLLDHLDDPRAVTAIAGALADPVPRVRRVAAHALGCVACKPAWDGALPDGLTERLARMAVEDSNAKVRAAALLACSVRR